MSSTPELPGPLIKALSDTAEEIAGWGAGNEAAIVRQAIAYLNAAPAREAQARAEALEEAAKAADETAEESRRLAQNTKAPMAQRLKAEGGQAALEALADLIRALKEKP